MKNFCLNLKENFFDNDIEILFKGDREKLRDLRKFRDFQCCFDYMEGFYIFMIIQNF